MFAHWRIHSTALAAACSTLGVELDPTEPYCRMIDEKTEKEQLTFLFAPVSSTDSTRVTEHLIGFWENRAAFEAKHPRHPLVPMRAVYDARTWLVRHTVHGGFVPPVRRTRAAKHQTPHLSEAAILKAHGFPLLMFTGQAWAFPLQHEGQNARQVLDQSQRVHGRSDAQWQARFLVNLNRFLAVAKAPPVVASREGERTLLLSVDASPKVRDFWQDQLIA